MKAFRYVLPLCLLFTAGCGADKLVLFEDGLLSPDEMKPLLGKYDLIEMSFAGKSTKPKDHKLVMEERGPKYFFSLSGLDEDGKRKTSEGYFILSKIPDSKSNLLLLASPKVKGKSSDGDDAEVVRNAFLVVKNEKSTINAWIIFGGQPVAKDHLSIKNHEFAASEVKDFLKKHADAFVLANPPTYTFKRLPAIRDPSHPNQGETQ